MYNILQRGRSRGCTIYYRGVGAGVHNILQRGRSRGCTIYYRGVGAGGAQYITEG